MFERFLDAFGATADREIRAMDAATAGAWVAVAGGASFEGGLYRVHTPASARASDGFVRDAFAEFEGRFACFGHDWLGRQFATDAGRGAREDPEVMLLEPGTGEALEIPVPFSRFHDEELVDFTEEALARSFFEQWLHAGGAAPTATQCVGYRRPLFLGGEDTIANLEVSDLDVYWTLMGQLRRQARGVPEGSSIDGIVLER